VTSGSGTTDEPGPVNHEDPTATAATEPVESSRAAKKSPPAWQETLFLIATAVVVALLLKTFFIQAFYIPSGSMRDTLKVNDRILVEKMSYWFGDVHRGDIVVFDDPANWLGQEGAHEADNAFTRALSTVGLYPTGGHLVKRVIGVGGDAVACGGGHLRVNGVTLAESSYVTLAPQSCDGRWSVKVPADHLWVMGDNRQNSADSRVHIGEPGGGFIPEDDVVGKVFVVVWPFDRWGFVHRPGDFDNDALDKAAGLFLGPTPAGLALLVAPPLYWRWKKRNGH
jgi:signal peptidase I